MLMLQFIVLQILVFAAVIYFLKKILMGDTQSAISRLDLVYQDLLNKQKELNEKIKAAEKEYQEKKNEATQIVEKMKTESLEEIRAKRDEMVKKAKAEAEEIVLKSQDSSEKLAQEIEQKMRDKTIDFVSDLINRTAGGRNLEGLHHAMVQEFLSQGKDLDLSNVGQQIDVLLIRSAMPISEDTKKQVESIVIQRLGRKLHVEEEVDKNLVAGLQLQFGTLILDGSFSNAVKEAAGEAKEEPLTK